MTPGIDGYEVCRRVRASNPDVPVIFLSAKSEEIDVVVGQGSGNIFDSLSRYAA
jgi:two-component system alkaline phosphatase synthesis response regulator PhoP